MHRLFFSFSLLAAIHRCNIFVSALKDTDTASLMQAASLSSRVRVSGTCARRKHVQISPGAGFYFTQVSPEKNDENQMV